LLPSELLPVSSRIWLILGLFAVLAASCGGGEKAPVVTGPSESFPQELINAGAEIYRMTCSVCHGREGQGGVGAPLLGVVARKSLEEHTAIVVGGSNAMPPFGPSLTPEEIRAVVAYERATFK
jgi:mono/diheme cytochrome c family protein